MYTRMDITSTASNCCRTCKQSWVTVVEHSLGSERGKQRWVFQQLKRGWRAAAEMGTCVILQRLGVLQLLNSLWNFPFLMNIPLFTVSPPKGLAMTHHRILSSTLQGLTCYCFSSQLKLWNDCLLLGNILIALLSSLGYSNEGSSCILPFTVIYAFRLMFPVKSSN